MTKTIRMDDDIVQIENGRSKLKGILSPSLNALESILGLKQIAIDDTDIKNIYNDLYRIVSYYISYFMGAKLESNDNLKKYLKNLGINFEYLSNEDKIFYLTGRSILSGKLTREQIIEYISLSLYRGDAILQNESPLSIELSNKLLAYNLCQLSILTFEESLYYYTIGGIGGQKTEEQTFKLYVFELAKVGKLTMQECEEYITIYIKEKNNQVITQQESDKYDSLKVKLYGIERLPEYDNLI